MQATQRCIEADLAATKAELKAVQLREKQLQAKNSLLEQMSTLSKAAMSMYAQVSLHPHHSIEVSHWELWESQLYI